VLSPFCGFVVPARSPIASSAAECGAGLAARFVGRGREGERDIAERLERTTGEAAEGADVVVRNAGDLAQAGEVFVGLPEDVGADRRRFTATRAWVTLLRRDGEACAWAGRSGPDEGPGEQAADRRPVLSAGSYLQGKSSISFS
jgi:hypothetical protein